MSKEEVLKKVRERKVKEKELRVMSAMVRFFPDDYTIGELEGLAVEVERLSGRIEEVRKEKRV